MPILCGSRREADRRIEDKKARDQQYSRARVSKARGNEDLKGKTVTITEEKRQAIQKIAQDLERFNQGASLP